MNIEKINTAGPDGEEVEVGFFTATDVLEIQMRSVTLEEKSYTFSVWIKSDNAGTMEIFGKSVDTTDDWERKVITFIPNREGCMQLMFTEGRYYIYRAKLEEGTFATTFTLAPEDYEGQITDVAGQVNTVTGQVTDVAGKVDTVTGQVTDVAGKVDTVTGQITDVAGKVDTVTGQVTDVAGKVDIVTGQITDVAGQVDGVKDQITDVAGQVEDVKNTVTTLGTTLDVVNGQIATKVWMTDIDLATGEIDQNYSMLNQTMTAISTRVATIEGDYATQTSYDQLSDKFSWIVASGSSASSMILTNNFYSLVSENIDLTGNVTFKSYSGAVDEMSGKVDSITGTVNEVTSTVDEVTSTVNQVTSTVDGITTTVNEVTNTVDGLSGTVDGISGTVGGISGTVDGIIRGTTTINGGSIDTDSFFARIITIPSSGQIIAPLLRSSDYSYSGGNYSSAGMIVDLRNKIIRTPYFGLTSDGRMYARSGSFTGEVTATSGSFTGSITAENGSIAGFVIGGSALYKGSSTLGGSGVYLGTNGISCGSAFQVNSAGNLTLEGGSVTADTLKAINSFYLRCNGTDKAVIQADPNNWNTTYSSINMGVIGTSYIHFQYQANTSPYLDLVSDMVTVYGHLSVYGYNPDVPSGRLTCGNITINGHENISGSATINGNVIVGSVLYAGGRRVEGNRIISPDEVYDWLCTSSGNLLPRANGSDSAANIGNSTGYIRHFYYQTLHQVSDSRKKHDIKYMSNMEAVDIIRNMKPCTYKYNDDSLDVKKYGLIAQDVRDYLRDRGKEMDGTLSIVRHTGEDETFITDLYADESEVRYGIDYIEYIAPLIKTAQYSLEWIDSLQNEIYMLRSEIEMLKSQIAA